MQSKAGRGRAVYKTVKSRRGKSVRVLAVRLHVHALWDVEPEETRKRTRLVTGWEFDSELGWDLGILEFPRDVALEDERTFLGAQAEEPCNGGPSLPRLSH